MNPNARVYTPPPDDEPYELDAEGGEAKRRWLIGAIMGVIVIALGGVAWNTYGGSGAPAVVPAPGPYKTAAAAPSEGAGEAREVYRMMEGETHPAAAEAAPSGLVSAAPPPPQAAQSVAPPAPAAQAAAAAAAPIVIASAQGQGAFLVQLAALRSADAARAAWTDLAGRNPGLLSGARMDIQRAELGAQGVYYRLRAGYFADRDRAAAFCDKAKTAGIACMVVSR